jgi:hypothetical protein
MSTATDIAEITKSLAWPDITAGFIVAFHRPIRTLLDRLAATLTIKVVKIKVFGTEIELTPEQAEGALDELLQEIVDSTNTASSDELLLFQRILSSAGSQTVGDIFKGFKRNTPAHEQLRKLRSCKLIRPREGDGWEIYKHPIVTRVGKLVSDLRFSRTLPK